MHKYIILILLITVIILDVSANVIFDEDYTNPLWDSYNNDNMQQESGKDTIYNGHEQYRFTDIEKQILLRSQGYTDGKNHDLLGSPRYYLPLLTTTLITGVAMAVDIDAFQCLIPTAGCLASSILFGALNARQNIDLGLHGAYEEGYMSGLRQKSYLDAFIKSTAGCCLGTLLTGFLFGIL
ncbi:MAG: hypothetical protein SVK54_01275 [candidate division WOR-3 bacterium]|nr:hypothetical protein [candidate division WOR-3 bacterium]